MKKTIFMACLSIALSGQMKSQIFINTTGTTNNTDPTYHNGKVSIGKTTSAVEVLDVNGNIGIPYTSYIGISDAAMSNRRMIQSNWDNSSMQDYVSFYTPGSNSLNQYEKMRITTSGNVGIGTGWQPEARLTVYESMNLAATVGGANLITSLCANTGSSGSSNNFKHNTWLQRSSAGSDWLSTSLHDGISIDVAFGTPTTSKTWWNRQPFLDQQSWGNGSTTYMKLDQGKLQIGQKKSTAHANAMLMVDGKIVCKDLYVTATSDWPDFVFDANYKLTNLYDVRDYYEKNKHLPNVPTACEIEEKGINISEISNIQMQKIEELTLYIVQLKTELDALKKEVTNKK